MESAGSQSSDERTALLPTGKGRDKQIVHENRTRLRRLAALVLCTLCAILVGASIFRSSEDVSDVSTHGQDLADFTATQIRFDRLGDPWHHLSEEARRKVKLLESELDKLHLEDAEKHLRELPTQIEQAIYNINVTGFTHWLDEASNGTLSEGPERLSAVRLEDLPADALEYVKEHPAEAALVVADTVAFFVPGLFWAPVLEALGFARLGVRAGSIAARLQSRIGAMVPKRGWFATLVSAAMGGSQPWRQKDQPPRTPNFFEDPKLHLGFAWRAFNFVKQCASDFFVETGKGLNAWGQQAGKDVGAWAGETAKDLDAWGQQAGKGILAAKETVNIDKANDWIHKAAATVGTEIEQLDKNDYEKWLKRACTGVGITNALEDLQAVKLEDLPPAAMKYVEEHPDQVAFFIVQGVVILAPVVLYGPMLGMLGFGSGGVVAGSLAAATQSIIGAAVPARGAFATATSAGRAGYGIALFNGVVRAGAVAAGLVKGALGYAGKQAESNITAC